MKELATKHGLKVHMDGARLFNAATALGVPVAQITQHVDSVTFCLSKVIIEIFKHLDCFHHAQCSPCYYKSYFSKLYLVRQD